MDTALETIYRYCEDNLNVNINWRDVLYEYIDDIYNLDNYNKDEQLRKRINKLIRKIKNLSWCDNPAANDNELTDNERYRNKQIEEVIKMFMSNDYTNKSIGILSSDTLQPLASTVARRVSATSEWQQSDYYKTLSERIYSIGSMFGYDCKIVYTVDDLNKNDIILPIASLTLSKHDVDNIDVNKLLFPTVHNYNIIHDDGTKYNKQCYDFIHMVDNYIKHNELTKREYNYIIVPCEHND